MKALWHLRCSTIKSPPRSGAWTSCECNRTAARWRDGSTGLFEVAEHPSVRGEARVIGFHNYWLALDKDGPKDSQWWQYATANLLEATPDTYLFKRQMSPVVIIAPGASGDTFPMPWEAYEGDVRTVVQDGSGG